MITINELIKELHLIDIKHVKLGDICSFKRGKIISNDEINSSFKKIYPVYSSKTLNNGILGFIDTYDFDGTYISWTTDGYAGEVFWHQNEKFNITNICGLISLKNKDKINLKFLYYYLKLNLKQYVNNSCPIPKMMEKDLYNLDIEFPPLPYQQQIVKILDDFTELEARKIQYKFWQNYLLNDKKWSTTNIIHIKLKDLFNYRNGYTPSTSNELFWKGGTIPWFRIDDIRNFGSILYDANKHITPIAVKGDRYIEPDSIIIATTATIGVHALIKVKSLCNQRFTILTLKDEYKNKVDIKFIYYYCYLLDKFCIEHQNASTFNSVDMLEFENFIFNIPPLEYQNKIVSILDQFNNLTTNLQDGIPAEIKLRKEQYQYYLKQLLNFNTQTK